MTLSFPAFAAGLALSLSLIAAIGPQNAHVLRMGLARRHLWLTVAVCMLSDVVLIAIGVLGLAQLGGLSGRLQDALIGAGMLFLTVYGWQAWQRFLHPDATATAVATPDRGGPGGAAMTRRQALLAALAFSWLNPHAWLDTAVLIGTASLAHGRDGTLFGVGAATGSLIWFAGLGGAAMWLGRRLDSPMLWRLLDALVAAMMWGTALWLLRGLLPGLP